MWQPDKQPSTDLPSPGASPPAGQPAPLSLAAGAARLSQSEASKGGAGLLLTVAGGKQSGTEAWWIWQVACPTSQHALLQPRPTRGLACLPKSQSLKSVPEFVFLHKRFSAWAPARCKSAVSLSSVWGRGRRLIFEYLDLCQRSGQYFEGDKTRDPDDEDTTSIPF